jgi:hypothetical protein
VRRDASAAADGDTAALRDALVLAEQAAEPVAAPDPNEVVAARRRWRLRDRRSLVERAVGAVRVVER